MARDNKKYDNSQKGKLHQLKKKRDQHNAATKDSDGEILIPTNVVDRQAWVLFVKQYDELINHPEYFYQTSDPELVINTVSNTGLIRDKISHLPKDEQAKILQVATRLRALSATAAQSKQKAFGMGVHSKTHAPSVKHRDFFKDRGAELIEYFGRYFTCSEVHKIITQEWGYHIGYNTLMDYRTDNLAKIAERQEVFKSQYSDVRLGHKRSRLDELTYLFNTRRDIYKASKRLDDSKELRALLEHVRKEVEGDSIMINGHLSVEHNIRIQDQVNMQLMANLNLKALIIARVAAKYNRNPVLLQYQLLNSYYAKFTGFRQADDDLLSDQILYPSSLIYDFEDLKRKNMSLMAEEAELVETLTPAPTPSDVANAQEVKDAIVKKLIERRAMNNKTEAIIAHRGEVIKPNKK